MIGSITAFGTRMPPRAPMIITVAELKPAACSVVRAYTATAMPKPMAARLAEAPISNRASGALPRPSGSPPSRGST